ncbi:MAG TPA: DUF2917 domain-containing protein [Casimicrobiaceae bacterium]|jgi:hypothetical protein
MPFDFAPVPSQRQFLPSRRSLRLDDAEGTVIAVESGCLWVTMENDPRDVILMPGMRFEVDRSGRTIIAAEEDSRFGLLAPGDCAEGLAARTARKLAALLGRRVSPRALHFVPYY